MKRRISILTALVVLVVTFVGSSAAQGLENRSGCFNNYLWCMFDASLFDSFIRRFAAGLDCYVDLARCVRDLILN